MCILWPSFNIGTGFPNAPSEPAALSLLPVSACSSRQANQSVSSHTAVMFCRVQEFCSRV